ncbi:MAG: protein-glutamate O-methyltransferase CheR [Actinobacteria bacterium]|nr:MAG: protein-glutamate O-methyltransferase CheR [Actinomycetota bacterium]
MMLAEQDFRYIQDLVRERAAIVLESGKEYLAVTRLDPLVRRAGLGSLAELVAALREEQTSTLHEEVVDALTTNETTWFRDVAPFESLRTHVLPDLIQRKRLSRTLFIWSAGCSSGQEPYSLVNRGLPAHLLIKYFHRLGVRWELDARIRSMVRFQRQSLVGPWTNLPVMDLVLMRNVMIYFDTPTKRQVLGRVRDVLAPHGYLLLGSAETTLHIDDAFQRLAVGPTGWYRRKQGSPVRTGQG